MIVITGTGFHKAGASEDLETYQVKHLRRMPPYVRSGLSAITKALKAAGRFPCPPEAALVTATSHGCKKTAFDFMDSIINDGPELASPLAFSHSVNNVGAALISICLGLHGSAITVNNGAASFVAALQVANALLDSGRYGLVIAGCMEDADKRILRVFPDTQMEAYSYFVILENVAHDS